MSADMASFSYFAHVVFLGLLLSFLLAAQLLHFRCVWPQFTISVISGMRHTVFSQHSRTVALNRGA